MDTKLQLYRHVRNFLHNDSMFQFREFAVADGLTNI